MTAHFCIMQIQEDLEAECNAEDVERAGKASKKKSGEQAARAAPARRRTDAARGNGNKPKHADVNLAA